MRQFQNKLLPDNGEKVPAISRVGDMDNGKGKIINGVDSVRVNNKAVGVVGSKVSPHGGGKHGAPNVQVGSGTVKANGRAITYVGALDSCGHKRSQGSPNVNVGR